ncbi:uncharacterized protein B0H18DRAFT_1083130 [Fomitopsis serialis]|uniref:uncharacterized protein n=1 Tax=Fomitopsis serialis TaxID=139415 RepID=UPI00200800BB|nr:uncharacterized protein B0H18DRAFT_1083130 [Neoantrodia serialis]KAH9932883.1 hypothetical protein B0H18DRAFT_1083130 [Neoantrodia serialis]
MRYTDTFGLPSARTIATRWSSPPESDGSRFIGFMTSVLNCGCINATLMRFSSSILTVPGKLGEIVWGFSDTLSDCFAVSSSGVSPASRRTNVVLPVPFSPSMTMISESVNVPDSTVSLNPPSCRVLSTISSSAVSTILNESDSSRKRRFSVGMKPSRKMLMPVRCEGVVG